MTNIHGSSKPRRFVGIGIAVLLVTSLPLLSRARTTTVSTSVNIVNNSSRSIRNVYLSHVGADDWSGNQLGDSTISPGQSFNLSLSWDQSQVKVIGEDSDGCFVSTVVTCGDNSTTWTVNNDTARDCGY